MSLFQRIHTIKVPREYLEDGEPVTALRFRQLNARKMGKANLADTLAALDLQNTIMAALSDEQRQAWLDRDRQRATDTESVKRAQERADAPDSFDDFDQHTLIALAHVEHQVDGKWIKLTDDQLDDLTCMKWLAGKIYDASRPTSAEAREKNS